jgi:hypothetical protein
MTTPFRWAFWMALSYLLSPISLLAQGTPIATTAFTRTMLRGADSAAVRTSLGFLTTNNTVITNYTGDGAAITNLNATELRSGTVPLARLSGITASQIAASTITTNNVDSTFYNLVTNRSSSGDVTQSGLAAGSYSYGNVLLPFGTNRLFIAGTNYNYFGANNALYPDTGGIIIGTNLGNFGPGDGGGYMGGAGSTAMMLVPNGFMMGDRWGSRMEFLPSHTDEPSSSPEKGVLLFRGGHDLVFQLAGNGGAQLGNSGNSYNQVFYLQYNQNVVGGYSHMLGFSTKPSDGGTVGTAIIVGQNNGVNGYSDLHFYTKDPEFPTIGTTGLSGEGVLAMSLATRVSPNAVTNSAIHLVKSVIERRERTLSTNVVIDFDSPSRLMAFVPPTTTVNISLTNQRAGTTNFSSKVVYIHAGESTLTLNWPTGLNVLSESGTNTLPTTLAGTNLLRLDIESFGAYTTNATIRWAKGTDNSTSIATTYNLYTNYSTTSAINNYSGHVGYTWTNSGANTVTALGRWVISGNSAGHVLTLVKMSDLSTVATVTLNTSGLTPGQFNYTNLASPVTLTDGVRYGIATQESNGGDQWYDASSGTLAVMSVGTYGQAMYGATIGTLGTLSFNRPYGPVDLKYQRP